MLKKEQYKVKKRGNILDSALFHGHYYSEKYIY